MTNDKKLKQFLEDAIYLTKETGIVVDFEHTNIWRLKSFRGKVGIYAIREHGVDEVYLSIKCMSQLNKERDISNGIYNIGDTSGFSQIHAKIEARVILFYACDINEKTENILKELNIKYRDSI